MSIQIDELMDYLDRHPVRNYEGSAASLMEMLHDLYIANNSIDSEKIREILGKFWDVLKMYPTDSAEELFSMVNELCAEQEVQAFSHGIVVGMHLMTEINYRYR